MAIPDALLQFLKENLCTVLGAKDALAALYGIREGEPVSVLPDFSGYLKTYACGTAPEDPATSSNFPGATFVNGPGWYCISTVLPKNQFTCAPAGESFQGIDYAPLGTFVSVLGPNGVEFRGGFGSCRYIFKKEINMRRPSGGTGILTAGGFLAEGGELQGYNIVRFDGTNQQVFRGSLPDGWNRRSGDIVVPGPGGGPSLTIPVIAAYGQVRVNFDSLVKIPVQVDLGGLNLTVNLDLSRDTIEILPGADGGDGRPGENPSDYLSDPLNPPPPPPGDVPGPEGGEGDSGSNPEGQPTIVAVLVTVEGGTDDLTVIYQDGGPDIYPPDLGLVTFLGRVDRQRWGWSSDIRVKNKRNLIPCPFPQGAIRVAGSPRPGVDWTLTPIYSRRREPLIIGD